MTVCRGRRAGPAAAGLRGQRRRCGWTARTSTCSGTATPRSSATPTGTAQPDQRRRRSCPSDDDADQRRARSSSPTPTSTRRPASATRTQQIGFHGLYLPTVPDGADRALVGAPGRAQPGADAGRLPGRPRPGRRHPAVGLRARPAPDRHRQAEQVGRAKLLRPGESWTLDDGSTVEFLGTQQWITSPSGTTRARRSCWSARCVLLVGLMVRCPGGAAGSGARVTPGRRRA